MVSRPPRRRASRTESDDVAESSVGLDVTSVRRLAGRLAGAGGRWLDARDRPRWVLWLLILAVPSQLLGVWRVLGDVPVGMRPPMLDSIIFEYVGWYLSVGGRLYVDVWEVKPPLPYEITALLAVLAGGEPTTLHWLGVGVSAVAAIGSALVAGAVVKDLTGDEVAAFAAGAALYVLPAFHWRAGYGFKVKYLVPLLLLGSLYLARRDRYGTSGALAGAVAASWQIAVVVPVLAAAESARRGGRAAAGRSVVAAAGVVGLTFLPVVAWGAVEAMVTETLLVPLLVGEDRTTLDQLRLARTLLGGALPVAALGIVGIVLAVRRRPRATWWVAAGTAWFALVVVFVDLDAPPDLFPLMAMLSVGVGLLLGLAGGDQRPAALLVAIIAVVSVATAGGFGFGASPLNQPPPIAYEPDREISPPYSPVERAHLFWRPERPETCRVFFGPTQHELVQRTGGELTPATCGEAAPVLEALLAPWRS